MRNLLRGLVLFGAISIELPIFADDCVGPIEALGGVSPNPQRIPPDSKSKVKKNPARTESTSTERGPAATVHWSPDMQERLKLKDLEFGETETPTSEEIMIAHDRLVAEAIQEQGSKDPEDRQNAKFKLGKYREALEFLKSRGRVE